MEVIQNKKVNKHKMKTKYLFFKFRKKLLANIIKIMAQKTIYRKLKSKDTYRKLQEVLIYLI